MPEGAPQGDCHVLVFRGAYETHQAVDFPDRGDAVFQGRGGARGGLRRDELGDCLGRRWQRSSLRFPAPCFKDDEVRPIAAQRVGGVCTLELSYC